MGDGAGGYDIARDARQWDEQRGRSRKDAASLELRYLKYQPQRSNSDASEHFLPDPDLLFYSSINSISFDTRIRSRPRILVRPFFLKGPSFPIDALKLAV
jgi:hypothetical protein